MSDPDPRPIHHYWFHGFMCGAVFICILWGAVSVGRWLG